MLLTEPTPPGSSNRVMRLGVTMNARTTMDGEMMVEMEMFTETVGSITTATTTTDKLLGVPCFKGVNPEATTKMILTSFWKRNPKAKTLTAYDNDSNSRRRCRRGAGVL